MNIETMTNADLVAAYNAVPGVKPTKRFPNRAVGIRRLKEAQEEARRAGVTEPRPSGAVSAAPAPRGAAKGAPVVNVAPKVEQKAPRPGSKRAQIIELLGRGAPVDEYAPIWGGRLDVRRIAVEVRYAASELGVGVTTRGGRWILDRP